MARVKLSEYAAKRLLVPGYTGVSIQSISLDEDIKNLNSNDTYVIKVDQGIKKRGKQGLLKLNVEKSSAKQAVTELADKGFDRFIAEQMFPHEDSEERYLSFERTKDGVVLAYSEYGGVDVEENPDSVKIYNASNIPVPSDFIQHVLEVMDAQHFSFVEINPLIIRDNHCHLLDAAVLADSAGEYVTNWDEHDIVDPHTPNENEAFVADLNRNSPAAFSFRVLNPNGALWLLLSGGGASITIADEAMNRGKADLVGNYGEYSGGPSTEETYLYTSQVIKQLFDSAAPKKALIIAGGVANFTDVKKTFAGVIHALQENTTALVEQGVKVYVRRGGPNETEGLAMMQKFLNESGLFGSVHGSDILLTDVINEALEYVDA